MSERTSHTTFAGAGLDDGPITMIGHPFAPIGMGEQMRSYLAACHAVGLRPLVHDAFRYARRTDPAHAALVGDAEVARVPAGIRVFHINGDEVEPVLAAFAARGGRFEDGYNVVVPAWELPRYPETWAAGLRRFDEVWSLSTHIRQSLATAGIAAPLVGQSVQLADGPMLPRRYFGLRESAFTLLALFDLSSWSSRKNPLAVVDLFDRLRAGDRFADIQLVLKVKHGEAAAADWAAAHRDDPGIVVIDSPLDSAEVRGLLGACDCFVSLHRAEGFGRGLGEAMMLGRLAMGTGWSGNTDFMTPRNSLLVGYETRPLTEGEYPHWQQQHWAEPDIAQAEALLRPILADPSRGRALAALGQADVARTHSNRAVGVRILDRLEAILAR